MQSLSWQTGRKHWENGKHQGLLQNGGEWLLLSCTRPSHTLAFFLSLEQPCSSHLWIFAYAISVALKFYPAFTSRLCLSVTYWRNFPWHFWLREISLHSCSTKQLSSAALTWHTCDFDVWTIISCMHFSSRSSMTVSAISLYVSLAPSMVPNTEKILNTYWMNGYIRLPQTCLPWCWLTPLRIAPFCLSTSTSLCNCLLVWSFHLGFLQTSLPKCSLASWLPFLVCSRE